ncbi:unnamed protein product [Heterobilharzia americana]|nr:unnamed protein product [Heterobilharzia americana]
MDNAYINIVILQFVLFFKFPKKSFLHMILATGVFFSLYTSENEKWPLEHNNPVCSKSTSIPHQFVLHPGNVQRVHIDLLRSHLVKHLSNEIPQPCLYPHILTIMCRYIDVIQFMIHIDEDFTTQFDDVLTTFNIDILVKLQQVMVSVYETSTKTRDYSYLTTIQIVSEAVTIMFGCMKYWKKKPIANSGYHRLLSDFMKLISQWCYSNISSHIPLKLASLDIITSVVDLHPQFACTDRQCHDVINIFLNNDINNNLLFTELQTCELSCCVDNWKSDIHFKYISYYYMNVFHQLHRLDRSILYHTQGILDCLPTYNKEFPYLFVLLRSFASQCKNSPVNKNVIDGTLVAYHLLLFFMHNHVLSLSSVYFLNEDFVQWFFYQLFELYFFIFPFISNLSDKNDKVCNYLTLNVIYTSLVHLVKNQDLFG